MAAQVVFGNYKLLERILLHLPLRSLLLTQRIDKACSDFIQRSSNIRRALFLKPSNKPIRTFESRTGGSWSNDLDRRESEDSENVVPVVSPFLTTHVDIVTGGPFIRAWAAQHRSGAVDWWNDLPYDAFESAVSKGHMILVKWHGSSPTRVECRLMGYACKDGGSDLASKSIEQTFPTQPSVGQLDVGGLGAGRQPRLGTIMGATLAHRGFPGFERVSLLLGMP